MRPRYTSGQLSLSKEKVEQLFLKSHTYEERLLLLIGFSIGLRRGDLVRIELEHIDTKNSTLSYFEMKKGNLLKTVPLTLRLNQELIRYIKFLGKTNNKYLFPNRQKNSSCDHMSDKTAYNIFNTICARANIKTPIPITVMRSSCVKIKVSCGWTIEQVAALIGDKASTVMDHYSTPSTGELAQLMKDKGGI